MLTTGGRSWGGWFVSVKPICLQRGEGKGFEVRLMLYMTCNIPCVDILCPTGEVKWGGEGEGLWAKSWGLDSNCFSKNTFQTSDGFGFFVDPASYYHEAAVKKKSEKTAKKKNHFFLTFLKHFPGFHAFYLLLDHFSPPYVISFVCYIFFSLHSSSVRL